MTPPEASAAIPFAGSSDDVQFPTPWAARAFAMTLALHERGDFTWTEWSETLGRCLKNQELDVEPENYWRAWTEALAIMVSQTGLASRAEIDRMTEAWRQTAEQTPHGEPLILQEFAQKTAHRLNR